MKLFSQLVKTALNVATLPITLPVAAAKDVTSGGTDKALSSLIERIKRESEEE
jgi:hypothetical protein